MTPAVSAAPPPRRLYTPEEDATIVRLYGRKSLLAIGKKLGRNYHSVQSRIIVLRRRGQLRARDLKLHTAWTADEDQELRGRVGYESVPSIAKALKRTVNAVAVRVKRLGLTRQWRGQYCASGVGRIFAVDSKTVNLWIARGLMVGEQSQVNAGASRRWCIQHEAVASFIAAHPTQYERRRIVEPYWRELADRAHARADLVSVLVASRIVGCADETIKRHIRLGRLRGERVRAGGGWAWMVRRSDLATFRYLHPPVRLEYARGRCGAIRKADVCSPISAAGGALMTNQREYSSNRAALAEQVHELGQEQATDA